MVRLGVGKNMVRSIRFWAETAGIIEADENGGHRVTSFGQNLLGEEGYDPYLERQETLWLLHWKISTSNPPIFYWNLMLNTWHRSDFSFSELLPVFERELPSKSRSPRTIADGFKVFIHTYVATRGKKFEVAEDNLDCPLVELNLVNTVGQRTDEISGKTEPLYSFNLDDKKEITATLFAYLVNDYWNNEGHTGDTLAFHLISTAKNSPGQLLKLQELAVRSRLEQLADATKGALEFQESSTIQHVVRTRAMDEIELLDNIYLPN